MEKNEKRTVVENVHMQSRVAIKQSLSSYVARLGLQALDCCVETVTLGRSERTPFDTNFGVGAWLTLGGDGQDGGGKGDEYGKELHQKERGGKECVGDVRRGLLDNRPERGRELVCPPVSAWIYSAVGCAWTRCFRVIAAYIRQENPPVANSWLRGVSPLTLQVSLVH